MIFFCRPEYGASEIVADFDRDDRLLVWLELTPLDADDPVAQGNRLAAALARRLGQELVGQGLSCAAVLAFLRGNQELLGPLTVAVSRAEYGPALVAGLLALEPRWQKVVLHFHELPTAFTPPPGALLISERELRLDRADAMVLAAGRIDERRVAKLLAASGGARYAFLAALHRELGMVPPLMPGPDGPRFLPGNEPTVEAEPLLTVLVARGRWHEALTLAAACLPGRVPEVLAEAGHALHEQGLHQRLWRLLEELPPTVQNHELVRFWRLSAAFRLGRSGDVAAEAARYLEDHDAPELRALYAGVALPPTAGLPEAERAYRTQATPLTAFQLGRLTRDAELAVARLQESVRLAERNGRGYEIVRNAGALASRLLLVGRYREAVHWSRWALTAFDRYRLGDAQRRVRILNGWAFARLLAGEPAGLEAFLTEAEAELGRSYPALAALLQTTLGDLCLLQGRPAAALEYYRRNFDRADRWMLGYAALNVVRALLELGESAAALELAAQAQALTKAEDALYRAPAELALGMALVDRDPRAALAPLRAAREAFERDLTVHRLAQAALYLARAQLRLGRRDEARAALAAVGAYPELSEMGLRLLAGPEDAFRELWSWRRDAEAPLELNLLGRAEVWLDGGRLELTPLSLEILTILVASERPLTLEALLARLYGDGGNKAALKTAVSKLRQQLPISRHPYRLELAVRTDFVLLQQALADGRVRDAVAGYRGRLLPWSEAPAIRELDAVLSEGLRQAALQAGDAEALLRLCDAFEGDLELLEAAAEALDPTDPRAPLVRAQAGRVHAAWGAEAWAVEEDGGKVRSRER